MTGVGVETQPPRSRGPGREEATTPGLEVLMTKRNFEIYIFKLS